MYKCKCLWFQDTNALILVSLVPLIGTMIFVWDSRSVTCALGISSPICKNRPFLTFGSHIHVSKRRFRSTKWVFIIHMTWLLPQQMPYYNLGQVILKLVTILEFNLYSDFTLGYYIHFLAFRSTCLRPGTRENSDGILCLNPIELSY